MNGAQADATAATIVITTYNRPDFARRAVASALGQTLTGVEVVVVDDGSDPPFVLDLDHDRVRVIRNDHATGVSSARNAGLRVARGAWVTFLDDDDVIDSEMLERSIAAAESSTLPGPVAVNPAVMVLDPDGSDGKTLVPAAALVKGEDYFLEGKGAAGRAANSLVVPTDVMRAVGGFDDHIVSFQHDDLGLRLNAVASIVGLTQPMYRMTTHPSQRLSTCWSAIPPDMERTIVQHRAAFERHPKAYAHLLGALAVYHLKAGVWVPAIRRAAGAVRRDPTRPRYWVYLGASLAGPSMLRVVRRMRPAVGVSTWELTKRRVRKYARRAADGPRAVAGDVTAPLSRALARRVARVRPLETRSVLVLCVYRARHAPNVRALVTDGDRRGWETRLWALDDVDPEIERATLGNGPGAKFPLLNALLDADVHAGRDWVVVVDDDVEFDGARIEALLGVAEASGLELVQPAQHELSRRHNDIVVRRPLAIARRTTFVEIGPVFAVRRSLASRVLPFPAAHTMGWGLELDWYRLAQDGAALGIVDLVPVRHTEPVGATYVKREQNERLRELVRDGGFSSFGDIQRTLATWRPWQASPPWSLR